MVHSARSGSTSQGSRRMCDPVPQAPHLQPCPLPAQTAAKLVHLWLALPIALLSSRLTWHQGRYRDPPLSSGAMRSLSHVGITTGWPSKAANSGAAIAAVAWSSLPHRCLRWSSQLATQHSSRGQPFRKRCSNWWQGAFVPEPLGGHLTRYWGVGKLKATRFKLWRGGCRRTPRQFSIGHSWQTWHTLT